MTKKERDEIANYATQNFTWQHVEFEHGGNPYICTTEREFNRIKRKYNLVRIQNNFWLAKNKQTQDKSCIRKEMNK